MYIRLSEVKQMRRQACATFLQLLQEHDRAEGLVPQAVLPQLLPGVRQDAGPPAQASTSPGDLEAGLGTQRGAMAEASGRLAGASVGEPRLRLLCRSPQQARS